MSLPGVPTAEELIQSTDFKDMIVRNLRKPANKPGLAGPMRGGECWERWLHQIVDGKVTKKYYRGEKKLWPEGLVIAVRQEVIGLAAKERAKLKAFEEILSQRSDLTRKSPADSARTSKAFSPAAPGRVVLEDTPEPVIKPELARTSKAFSPAAPGRVVLEDTPEPAIKPELAQTPQQPTPRQVVLEFNAGDQSNRELACETAKRSGAASAKVVLLFRYMYAPWCQDMLTGGL